MGIRQANKILNKVPGSHKSSTVRTAFARCSKVNRLWLKTGYGVSYNPCPIISKIAKDIDMIARLGLMVFWFALSFSAANEANAQTFGLSVSTKAHGVTASNFGLGSSLAITPAMTIQETAKPDTPSPAFPPVVAQRVTVVRRARLSWVDSAGAWSVERLRSHLATGHAVPSSELAGRTFRELSDIHDNLHEGFAWNGVTVQVQTFTVQTKTMGGNCPGGVCPMPTSRPVVRRLFRR